MISLITSFLIKDANVRLVLIRKAIDMEKLDASSKNLDSEEEMSDYQRIEKKDKDERRNTVTVMFLVSAIIFTSAKKENI